MPRRAPSPAPMSGGGGDDGSDGRTQKRPSSSLDDIVSDRASKRRASRACLSCRTRKVRCDVVDRGVPCTNCHLDGVDCAIAESNRGRRSMAAAAAPATITVHPYCPAGCHPHARPYPPAPPPPPPPPPPACHHHHSPPQPRPPDNPQSAIPSPPAHADEYLVSLSFENQQQPAARLRGAHTGTHTGLSSHLQPQRTRLTSDMSSPTPSPAQPSDPPSTGHASRFPAFIQPLPPHITSEDLDYLGRKDALTIPDDAMRDELLRAYAENVHPFMPALDLHSFLDSVLEPRTNSVSLLLFQAVMFASIAFVDVELVQSRGFANRKAARKVFFNRVRLLYGLDCESDQTVLVQTLLLMTYWYDNPNDKKDTWYWMGIALTLAQVAGFHRDPKDMPISSREKGLRRRIWWSCVLRDRLLALGVRRPSRIRDGDFDVPVLAVDDFNLSPASDNLLRILGRSEMTDTNPEARSVMATLCVELTKLSLCLGHILHSQYTVTGPPGMGSEHLSSVTVVPKRSERQAQELVKCDQELVEWFQSRDPRSKYAPVSDRNPEMAARIIHLHQSLLHMIYLAALGLLHRPPVFCSTPGPDSNSTRKISRKKVTEAAIAMTELAFDLEDNDQLRYLSTSGVPAFLSATLIHLLEIRSSDERVRSISIGRFYQSMHVLHELQDTYASADCAVQFLEKVLRVTDIKVPMLKLTSASKDRQEPDKGLYPSPSSFNQHLPLTGAAAEALDSLPIGWTQPVSPLINSFEAWQSAGSSALWQHDIHLPTDIIAVSPYVGGWADVDSLIPCNDPCHD